MWSKAESREFTARIRGRRGEVRLKAPLGAIRRVKGGCYPNMVVKDGICGDASPIAGNLFPFIHLLVCIGAAEVTVVDAGVSRQLAVAAPQRQWADTLAIV
jgi:hypothetical protein